MKANTILLPFLAFVIFSCKNHNQENPQTWHTKQKAIANEVHNQLLGIEKEQGWQLLFDGKTLNGWHLYNKPDSTKFSAWKVQDGMLFCNASDESKIHGDLISDTEFTNYELYFEWRIPDRGNSGVFINVLEKPEIPNTYQTGPEYQLLGAGHMDYGVPTKSPGCLYGFLPLQNVAEVKPLGQWNTSRIVQQDGKVEFYLNGILTAKENFSSPEWRAKIAASGFAGQSGYGRATQGKIALQNWYFEVWFRNIKLKEL